MPPEAHPAVDAPAPHPQPTPDGLGAALARAVACRAQDAPVSGMLQRSPRTWTQAAETQAIAAMTPGRASTSLWPPLQARVASYGRLAEGDVQLREAALGEVEHAMARWRSNQRRSLFRTDLEKRKFAALDGLAALIARERAEIAAARTRAGEQAAAVQVRAPAPPTARLAAPTGDTVVPRPHVPRAVELAPMVPGPNPHIGDFVDAHDGSRHDVELFWQKEIVRAYAVGDAERMADLRTQLELLELEHHYVLPTSLELAFTRERLVSLAEATDEDDLRGGFLGCPHVGAPWPIPGFEWAESVGLDRYFGSRIRAAATGSEADRREVVAELTDAGLEHRYVQDSDGDAGDASMDPFAIGAVAFGLPARIPGFSPRESARTDGYSRRRIRAAFRSGDAALAAAIHAELIEQGLEFRYVRAYGSNEHGQVHGEHADLYGDHVRGVLDALTNPAGGDQAAPSFGLREPGAVGGDQPHPIPGLTPRDSARLDGHFARAIREATRMADPERRATLLAQIDAELVRRGIEHRYIRAVDADLTPRFYPDEPAADQGAGRVSILAPELIPGLSPQESAETDVYFRREIRRVAKGGRPVLVKHVRAQLAARGLADRYLWDTQ